MSKTERTVLWVIVGFLALCIVWLIGGTAMVIGEFQAINAILAERSGQAGAGSVSEGWSGPIEGEPQPVVGSQVSHQVGVAGVRVLENTLVMTVTVRASGAGDLLYEPPVLLAEGGQRYGITGESLEAARFAFLDLVTRGQATVRLEFAETPPDGARLTLVFNPSQQPRDPVSPRIEAPVPMIAPTPTPKAGDE